MQNQEYVGGQKLSRRQIVQAASAIAMGLGLPARAQTPAPYTIVIAFPPGGTSTASLEPMRLPLGGRLGAPVQLEYQPGAGGDLAAMHVSKAASDGKTLLFGHAGPLAINPHLTVRSFYDPLKDLVAVARIVQFPIVVCAHAKHDISTLDALVALAKSRMLVMGSSGNGSIQHLAGEMFRHVYGLKTVHLPFLGGGPLQEALVKGVLDVLCETGSNVVRHIAEGRLKGIAVMAKQRIALLPDVPTFEELGVGELDISAWFGLLAPAATALDRVMAIGEAALASLREENVQAALTKIGGIPAPLGGADFGRFIRGEAQRWGETIRTAGLRPLGNDIGIGAPQ